MFSVFKLICELFNLIFGTIFLLFLLWSFWHGAKIESGGLIIELYGIKRFFK
jgi:hypothetical protein